MKINKLTSNRKNHPEKKGRIFDVQRYSIHDGPGIRTIIFLKGCPMHCLWCSNPESQTYDQEVAIYQDKCIKCGSCTKVCSTGALTIGLNGVEIDRAKCQRCGKCGQVCFTGAIRFVGQDITVKEAAEELMKDRAFYRKSGGGITVSGGEPLIQIDFLEALLKECKARGVDTAIETTGYAQWQDIQKIAALLDQILFDIKIMDAQKHQNLIGVPNEIILQNARRLAVDFKEKMVIRVPIIPGYNDAPEEIRQIFKFSWELGVKNIHLLPFHPLGESKYQNLGAEYKLKKTVTPKDNELQIFLEQGSEMGLKVKLRG